MINKAFYHLFDYIYKEFYHLLDYIIYRCLIIIMDVFSDVVALSKIMHMRPQLLKLGIRSPLTPHGEEIDLERLEGFVCLQSCLQSPCLIWDVRSSVYACNHRQLNTPPLNRQVWSGAMLSSCGTIPGLTFGTPLWPGEEVVKKEHHTVARHPSPRSLCLRWGKGKEDRIWSNTPSSLLSFCPFLPLVASETSRLLTHFCVSVFKEAGVT